MDATRSARSRGEKMINGVQSRRFPAGRDCEAPGCSTQLWGYNPAATCSRHDGWKVTTAHPRLATVEGTPLMNWVAGVMTGDVPGSVAPEIAATRSGPSPLG